MNNTMITMSDLKSIVETDSSVEKATVKRNYLFNPKRTHLQLEVTFIDGGYWATQSARQGDHYMDNDFAIMIETSYQTFELHMEGLL